MPLYLSILRGINVGGHKKIKMADLKVLYEKLQFQRVQTYIQSGNVIFETPQSTPENLAGLIGNAIQKAYGFEVPVLVLPAEHWHSIKINNPFVNQGQDDASKLHVTVLAETPDQEHLEKLQMVSFPPDEFHYSPTEKCIYLFCPNGYSRTKLGNNFFERKLKVAATTRTWKTVLALADRMGG